jgi:predicted O-methyltransferase YrrM
MKTILKNLIDRLVMTVLDKLPRRFKNRVRLIVAAIFAKNSVLEETMASIQKLPDVVLRGWGNPYDVLMGLLPQYGPLDRDTLELVDRERHIESSEIDVARFLYSIVRHSRAKTIIEIGVFHGAGSLPMSQAVDENGGGEVHLVDISKEFLQDVSKKIENKKWKVKIFQHHLKTNGENDVINFPETDVLFIDACHTYEAVKNDLKKYRPLVSKGGFLILHDTVFHPGPRRVAREMFENGFKGCSITTSQGSGITIFQC